MDDDNIEATDVYNGALDKSADLLEQQQAREQARLLQRFQELRRWQQQQQDQLLMQQQMQLSKLREEQMRAQTSFTKHRQQQWGSGKVKTAGLQTMPMSATKTPPKSRPRTVGADLGSMLALLSSTQIGPDPLTPPAAPVPPSQDNVVKGLPRPVMYGPVPPFNDGDNSTNPDLFSNPASRAPSIISSDEGFFPIPDTASEFSHPSTGPPPAPQATAQFATLQALLQKASPELFQQFMSLYPGAAAAAASSIPSPQPPASFSQSSHASMSQANSSQLSSFHLHVPHAPAPVGQAPPMGYPAQHPQHLNIPAASAANAANLSSQDLTTPPVEHPKMPPPATPPRPGTARRLRESQRSFMDHNDNCSSPVRLSDSRVDRVLYDQLIEEDLEGVEVTLASGFESPSMAREEEYEEDFEDEDEEESALQKTVLEAKQQSPTSHPLSIDDRPIKPAGTKTFEQLLEEKLLEETEKEMLAGEEKKSPRKPFLRKGQGLSRFEAGSKAGARSSPKDREARQHSPSNLRPEGGRRDPSASRASPPSKTEAPSRKSGVQREPIKSKPPPAQSQAKSGKARPTQSSAMSAPGKSSGQQGTRLQTQGSKVPPAAKPAQEPPRESKSTMVARQRKTSDESVLGEASFMARIKAREEDEKVEQEELEEFELLEDFADNVSFCSNSSVVTKLVQREQNKKQGLQTTDLKTIIEMKRMEKEKKFHFTSHQTPEVTEIEIQTEPNDDTLVEDTEDDDDSYKTISDSEDDAVAKTKPAKIDSWVQAEASFRDPVIFENHNQNYHDSSSSEEDTTEESAWPQPGRHLVRKVATQESKFGVSTTDTRTLLQRLAGNPAVPVVSQPGSSRLEIPGRGGVVDKTVVTTEKLGARSAKDRDSSSESGSTEDADDEEEDEEKREKERSEEDDTTEKKTLDDPSTAAADKGSDSEEEVDELEFDDEDEWIDTAPKSNKAKAGKEQDPGTPPTSKLVSKLFPKLNSKSRQAQQQQQEEERLRTASQQPLGEGLQSRLLRDKLAELDREIEKFRHENQTLDKLRKDREEGITRLKQQIADFEKEKSEELARLEEFKAQEMKKLKHERKMFEKYQKTVRSMPDKKEREEIETLTKQLSELQEELRRKEGRWQSSNSRLRSKLEEVEVENRELKEEIKLLEKKRLEWMQTQKEAGQKNGLRSTLPRSSTPTKEVESPARPLKSPREATLNHSGPNHHKFSKTSPGTVNGWPDVSHRASQPSQHPFSSSFTQADPALHIDSLSKTDLDLHNSLGSSGSRSILPRKQMTKFNIDNPSIDKGDQEFEETQHPDGKLERIYSNKAREILFGNGTRKEISSDGKTIVVSFSNGDIKQMFPDQRVVYYYAATGTIHTTYPDGLEVLQFKDNQVEKRYPDGTKEITFPDQTIKYLFTDGSEETLVPDGTMVRVQNGIKVITFTNGQREIHTDDYKRREFPDGTSKTVYPDGRQVTLFASRRKRVKDKEGNVVFDQIVPEGEPFDEVPRLPKFFMGRSAAF